MDLAVKDMGHASPAARRQYVDVELRQLVFGTANGAQGFFPTPAGDQRREDFADDEGRRHGVEERRAFGGDQNVDSPI